MRGLIKGAEVTYKDSDEITIRPGYGECNGQYWELTSPLDVDLYSVLPVGEDFVYIYIDDSSSAYPAPTVIGDTVEPAWSDAKMGWYNGNDRCIGVVWSPSAGRIIQEFIDIGDDKCIYKPTAYKNVLTSGNPSGEWTTLSPSAAPYIPVNADEVYVSAWNSDTESVLVGVGAAESEVTAEILSSGYGDIVFGRAWICLKRGGTRNLMWLGWDDDNNNFIIALDGYKIRR
jgi:hypothetical protein